MQGWLMFGYCALLLLMVLLFLAVLVAPLFNGGMPL